MTRTRKRIAGLLALPALALSGCYVVPVAPDGTPLYPVQGPAPAFVVQVPYPAAPHATAPAPAAVPVPPHPTVLTARLYPSNETAAQYGMVTGTVTNMMTGKGRFQMEYRGEVLVGEATRVENDQKRGVASAYSPQGTYMSCEYRMTTAQQGTGTCTVSNGARYTVHLGG
ncbi:MAG TPA: hypothetical protein VFX05_14775 [Casimicrobiaceae bacterium]|nr:hypothetical protein [Casimicrobiaceae bacterium]